MPSPTAHFSHDHGAGMQANAHGELYPFLPCQARIERCGDGRDSAQPRMHPSQGIVFMRHWPAKVHQQAISEILRDVARVLLNHLSRSRLVGPHDLAQVFGVELLGEARGVRQVAEHHGQLPAFRCRGNAGRGRSIAQHLVSCACCAAVHGGSPSALWSGWRLVRRDHCWTMRRRQGGGDAWRQGRDSGRPDCRGVGARWLAWHGHRRGRRGLARTGPDQDLPLFIDGQSSQGEFFPDLLQQRLVEAKDICERAIRDPPLMPQQADYRWEHGVETHFRPSPWSLWLDRASGCRLCGKGGCTVIAEGCR
jgi:hypothetical protein